MKAKRSFGFFDCCRASSVKVEEQTAENLSNKSQLEKRKIISFNGIEMPHLQSYDSMPSCSSDLGIDDEMKSVSSMTDTLYFDACTSITPATIDDSKDSAISASDISASILICSEFFRQLKMPKPIPIRTFESDHAECMVISATGGY